MGSVYEFSDEQNKELTSLCEFGKALAYSVFLAGVAMGSLFFMQVAKASSNSGPPPYYVLLVLLVIILFTWLPVAISQIIVKFELIVETEGQDMHYLTSSFESMAQTLKHLTRLMWVSVFGVIVISAISVGGGF